MYTRRCIIFTLILPIRKRHKNAHKLIKERLIQQICNYRALALAIVDAIEFSREYGLNFTIVSLAPKHTQSIFHF